jgi:Leucine-rich repeat (LRR) protein
MKKIKWFKEKLKFRKKVTKFFSSSAVGDQNLTKEANDSLIQHLSEESVTKKEEILLPNEIISFESKRKQQETINNIKNILLIGRTGNGKSTLANVLTGTKSFAESESAVSKTRNIQHEQFNVDDNKYLIIDTPGLGDTKLSQEKILDIIAEAVYLVKEGVSQVLFISKGRFDQFEMATYDLLRTIIFDAEVVKYTTLIRTNFAEFEDEEECKKDLVAMKRESDLAEVVGSCQNRVIHVDNPPIKANLPKKLRELNKEQRIESKKKLSEYLNKNCQASFYQPPKLQSLSNQISTDYSEYLTKKEELERELKRLRSQSSPRSESSHAIPLIINNPKPIVDLTTSSTESSTQVEFLELDIEIGEKIAHLENIKERLQREIAEKEKIIRQKVLKHILNNYESITEQLGGETFLTNLADDDNDWTKLHPEFNKQELKLKWLKEFDYSETNKWKKGLSKDFQPNRDLNFCLWLCDNKHYTAESFQQLSYPDIQRLISEYAQLLGEEVKCYDKHNQSLAAQEPATWTAINSNFADRPWDWAEKTYQQLWVSQNLTQSQAQSALSQGFTLDDFMFLAWLRDDKGLNIEQIKATEIESLRTEYQVAWTQLDAKFVKQARGNITYQQYWEAYGFNYTEAQQWIKLNGVGNAYYCWPWRWIEQSFDLATTAVWLANGLKENETGLAVYARAKNYLPNSDSVQKLKAEGIPAQHWLDWKYPLEQRNTITKLNISGTNLTGELDLSDLVNLTRLDCPNNQLTSLNLVNCQQLKIFWGHDNLLTDLVLPTSAEQLTSLSLSRNSFPTQQLTQFSHLVNCEYLDISNNPWTGSLVPLSNLTKLKELRIDNSELTELDLDSLPSGLTSLDIGNNPNLVSPDLTAGTQLVNLAGLYCQGTKLATRLEVYGQPSEYNNYIHLLKKAQQTQSQNQVEIITNKK